MLKDYAALQPQWLQLTNIHTNYCKKPAHISISLKLYINSFLLYSVNPLNPKIHL